MNITEDKKELFKAISLAQGEFTTVEKGKANPFFKSKYAPLDSIIEMIRPVMVKHGLSCIQLTDVEENGIVVETVITHESGQYISGRLFMPAAKQDPQGYGSALTYGRRYGLAAALGIVSDEDVDGNGAGNGQNKQPVKTEAAQGKDTDTKKPQPPSIIDTIIGRIDDYLGANPDGTIFTMKELEDWYTGEDSKLKPYKAKLNAAELSTANKKYGEIKTALQEKWNAINKPANSSNPAKTKEHF